MNPDLKKIKRIAGRAAALGLAAGIAFETPFAAAAGFWSKDFKGWTYTDDKGEKITGKWITDNGKWYLFGADGYMKTGWQLSNGKWYFLNVASNTVMPEGAMLTGWQWIDGKCYYFEPVGNAARAIGSMYVNEKTPDGYTVNAEGQWTENGNVVTVAGKGISTVTAAAAGTGGYASAGGGGGGGGSSSGGSSSNSSSGKTDSGSSSSKNDTSDGTSSDTRKDDASDTKSDTKTDTKTDDKGTADETGSYTVEYVDTDGNTIYVLLFTGIYGKTVDIETPHINGYTYKSGGGEKPFTKSNTFFKVVYEKNVSSDDEKKEEEKAESYSFTFTYLDSESGELIGSSASKKAKEGSVVTWEEESVKGYSIAPGNNLTHALTADDKEFPILFKKDNAVSYRIVWKDEAGKILKEIEGTGKSGDTVLVPELGLSEYEAEDAEALILGEENERTITCTYAGVASPTEITEYVSYEIIYKDFDSGDTVRKEKGKTERGTVLTPEWDAPGYIYASDDYELLAPDKTNKLTVELIKEESEIEDDVVVADYEAMCVNADGESLMTFSGKASVLSSGSDVEVLRTIKGYTQTGDTTFTMYPSEENLITLSYEADSDDTDPDDGKTHVTYVLTLKDISDGKVIGTDEIDAYVGAYLDFSDYEAPDGYEPAGIFPDEIRVSGESSNNKMTLYFTKITESEETVKYANWTVNYVNYDDTSESVLPSQTGRSKVGKFPVYFNKEYKIGSKLWKAVDSSPRTFNIKGNTDMNVFNVRFKLVSEDEAEDLTRTYALRYIASDTGSCLGVSVGEAEVGDILPLRNTWTDYMYADGDTYTVTDSDNEADITFSRNTVGQPDKNPHTDDYDGYEFLAVFVDQYGNALFDPVRGKVRSGDTFYIDYPDTVIRDGITYRAESKSPYKTFEGGTEYRQFEIRYVAGDSSEDKLSAWLQTAQEAKDDFYGTTPYRYEINLKEYSSWNSVGLYVGVAPKGTEVDINSVDVPGWLMRNDGEKSFVLDEDGKSLSVEYDKVTEDPSTYDYEREFTISFKDSDGNDLFDPFTGKAAFSRLNQTIDYYVYFPRTFTDSEGNRWRTDAEYPSDFVLRCNNDSDDNDHAIEYYKIYDNEKKEFIVENDVEVREYISDIGSYVYDTELHDFYLIGKDYDPSKAVVSETLYGFNLTGYQGAIEDTFEISGVTYKVYHFRLSRAFEEETCDHEWEYAEELPGNCYVSAQTTVVCRKCRAEKKVYKGALGHIDYDHDRVCDVCGEQLSISVGESITVDWDGEEYYEGKKLSMEFTCIGKDADGNYVLMAETDLTGDIFGTYASDGHGYFSTSSLHAFLNDGFADGLSVKHNLVNKDGDIVTILTKEQYDAYRTAAGEDYIFPDGTFILQSEDEDTVLTTAGTVSVAEANDMAVRPVIVLPASTADVGAEGGAWALDDLQARKIGDRVWLFRCVDENYEDQSATPKHLALFLCDTVIPSNYEMGFGIDASEDQEGKQETRFFSTTDNNYKYSTVASWLKAETPDTGDLIKVNVGIKNEYTGETQKGLWNRFQASDLTAVKRTTAQVFYANIFIPSVEEAVAMKDYLFKFNGSDKNNADEIVNNYRCGYFLRTPKSGTTDEIYYVDLVTGRISTTNATARSYDDVCEVGIRPVYIVEQFV